MVDEPTGENPEAPAVFEPAHQNPDDLLNDARNAARAVKGAWQLYDDRRAGELALKALRLYQDLDTLVTVKAVELPREWQP